MNPILLIGGEPKGYAEPFDIRTRSGKIIRPLLEQSGRQWILLDLWNDRNEELKGEITPFARNMILWALHYQYDVYVLGRYQENQLRKAGISLPYLPHPSSWRKSDQDWLHDELLGITNRLDDIAGGRPTRCPNCGNEGPEAYKPDYRGTKGGWTCNICGYFSFDPER